MQSPLGMLRSVGAAFTLALVAAAAGCTGDAGAGGASAGASLSQGETGAPYPIVLAHGIFGFDRFAGIETLTYFYGVKDYLASRGEHVFTPAVDPFNDSDHRAARLIEHIERIRQETGASKVNIIGHSQGGLDARLVAQLRPDLVASVTTVAAPHHGTPIADVLDASFPGSGLVHSVVDHLIRVTLKPLWQEIGDATSLERGLAQLSTSGMETFNARVADQPGIPYFSIAGRSDDSLGGDDCKTAAAPAFITRWARAEDDMQPLLDASLFIVDGSGHPNDGLVRVRDAKWGTFLGCIPADHFDEVGQILDGDPDGRHWNHKQFYGDLIAYLRSRGL